MIGWQELILVLVIVLLLVGARRLPEIGRAMGEAVRQFQRALRGRDDDDDAS